MLSSQGSQHTQYQFELSFGSTRELALGLSREHLLSKTLHLLFEQQLDKVASINPEYFNEPVRRMFYYLSKYKIGVLTIEGNYQQYSLLNFIAQYVSPAFTSSNFLREKLAVSEHEWGLSIDITHYLAESKLNDQLALPCQIQLTKNNLALKANNAVDLVHLLSQFFLLVRALHVFFGELNLFEKIKGSCYDRLSPAQKNITRLLEKYALVTLASSGEIHFSSVLEYFSTSHPHSIQPYVAMAASPAWWRSYGALEYSLLSNGASSFQRVMGESLYEYYSKREAEKMVFDAGVACFSHQTDHCCLEVLSVPNDHAYFVVDIGGGLGQLAKNIKAQCPKTEVTLFEQPHVIDDILHTSGSDLQIKTRRGSFFNPEEIPANKNLYILKLVMHNYDDKTAIQILKNIRQSMGAHSQLAIIEEPLTNNTDCHFMHLSMMMLLGAQERTIAHYQALVKQASFTEFTRLVKTSDHQSIMIANSGLSLTHSHTEKINNNNLSHCSMTLLAQDKMGESTFPSANIKTMVS